MMVPFFGGFSVYTGMQSPLFAEILAMEAAVGRN